MISVPLNGENGIWTEKDAIRYKLEQRQNKLRQQKQMQQEKMKEQGLIKPKITDINGMSKLRNRGTA